MNTAPIDALAQVYENQNLHAVLPSKHEADGMIFAVAAAPEIPMPEAWMPWLIKQSSSVMVDQDVDALADVLMNTLRAHLMAMRDSNPNLPSACYFRPGIDIRQSAVTQWLTGLLYAHQQLESVWQEAWDRYEKQPPNEQTSHAEAPEKVLARCLKLFSTLANVELALSQRNDVQKKMLQENLPLLWQQLPAMLNEYVTLAGELASALPNQFETFTQTKT